MKNYPPFIIILSILSLLMFFFLISPKYEDWNSFKLEISKKEIELGFQGAYLAKLREVSAELKQNQEAFLKIESALPREASLPELLNFFQKAASQSGLVLRALSPSTNSPVGGSGTKETKVNLILDGKYSDFKNFLAIIEKSARLVEVENIYFNSPREGAETFTFNIATKVYSY